ncbi:hypothetical protein [Cellulosilyticum sp. I15G10I2]|uniref:hypothetical protein n=1 Tax=Cellulosilyticum sp. I15G10I2 TaxID=1892843 RepID=UPI00085C15B8|nr:hypothetical protein [Cellulosilyticum sp. I15G10I2]
METSQIVQWGLQIVMTGILGWLAYFIKKGEERRDLKERQQDEEIKEVKQELSNLKADLPLIYVTREDYIRTMNNVDNKLDKIYDSMMRGGMSSGK